MVSQKKDTSGLGRRGKKDEPNGGEWWLKGFESALGRIGTGHNEEGKAAQKDGLYGGFFVKGQSLGGTIDEGVKSRVKGHKKRKSDAIEDEVLKEPSTSSPPHKASKTENGAASRGPIADFVQASAFFKARDQDKEDKRRRKTERQDRKDNSEILDEFQQIEAYLGSRDVEEIERKRRKRAAMRGRESIANLRKSVDEDQKEQRRERRRRHREERKNENTERHAKVGEDEEKRQAEKRRRKEERRLRRAERASQGARDSGGIELVEAISGLAKKNTKRKNER